MERKRSKHIAEIEDFWPNRQHDTKVDLDVKVDVFTGGVSESTIRFNVPLVSHVTTPLKVRTFHEEASRPFETEWQMNAVGFVPPTMRYWTNIHHPGDFTIVRLSERFFKNAAHETFDPDKVPYRVLYAEPDPVAPQLIGSLKNLAIHGKQHEWPMLVDWIGTAIAGRFLQILNNTNEFEQDDALANALSSSRLRRVIEYIESSIDKPIRLADLAGVAAMSMFHFSRAFRKATGMTPVRYLWRRRVERARILLRNRAVPIAVVAFSCGFTSQSHFTTVFKRETGITPAEFRRQTL